LNALKQRWQYWALRIDALSFRERVLVFLAVAGVLMSLMFIGLIEPELKRQDQMQQIIAGLQQEMLDQRAQLADRNRLRQSGHDNELTRLNKHIRAIEAEVKTREIGLVPPERMVAALRALLAEESGLILLSLETEPAQPAVGDPAAADMAAEATPVPAGERFYKHGITVQIEGAYAALTGYLARLERQPWTVQWESVRVDASQHPKLVMTLKLNTLSREPTWARL